MKKKLLLLSLVLVLVFTVTACGNGGGGGGGADGGPEFTIRFAHAENEYTATAMGVRVFQRLVEEYSEGRIAVEVHGAMALGDERQILESVIMGQLEAGLIMSALMTTYLPNWDVSDLPFAFVDRDDWTAKISGELGDLLAEEAREINLHILNFFDGGFRAIANNVRPVYQLSDLAGMDTRVGQSPLLLAIHSALGTNPIAMAFGEIYTGLQLGTIEAVETAIIYIVDGNFHEVTDYLTLTNTTALQMITMMNLDFYNSLPPDLQAVIDRATAETFIEQRRLAIELDIEALEIISNAGVQIHTPSAAFMQEMKDVTAGVVEEFRAGIDPRLIELVGF